MRPIRQQQLPFVFGGQAFRGSGLCKYETYLSLQLLRSSATVSIIIFGISCESSVRQALFSLKNTEMSCHLLQLWLVFSGLKLVPSIRALSTIFILWYDPRLPTGKAKY